MKRNDKIQLLESLRAGEITLEELQAYLKRDEFIGYNPKTKRLINAGQFNSIIKNENKVGAKLKDHIFDYFVKVLNEDESSMMIKIHDWHIAV